MDPTTFWGTAIRPGVSRNGRLYTKEQLAAAAAAAQERLTAGDRPMVMLTHHGAEDDSTRIVGRLTEIRQRPDGSLAFTSKFASTVTAQEFAKLVDPEDPFLKGVSIRGWWEGPVRKVQYEGQEVETGDVLVLDGLDFTKSPGVLGAQVEGLGGLATESADGKTLVYESVTEVTAAPTQEEVVGTGPFADLGYRDGAKRLPIGTREHAERSWRQVAEADTSGYTAAQLKRVRGRIKKALHGFGAADVTTESTTTRLGEVTEYYGDRDTAGFCIDAYNGPLSLSLRTYGVDPVELRIVAQKAMDAAVSALQALDPDMDGDIDVTGAESTTRPDDNAMETRLPYVTPADHITEAHLDVLRRSGHPLPPGYRPTAADVNAAIDALAKTTPAAPVGETTTPQEVPAVSEQPTNQAAAGTATTTPATAAPVFQLTQEQFAQLLAQRPAATETAAPAAPAVEAAPAAAAVAETDEQRLARLVTAGVSAAMEGFKSELRAEMQQAGPARRGFVVQTTTDESEIPKDKPFDSLPQEKRDAIERDSLLKHFNFAEAK